MFFQTLDLTTALRPELLPDETLLFVQDSVGLYDGKYKIPDYQNGHVYLTSHRICYIDNVEPRQNSTAIALKTVERYEYYAGFLKSSAKITLYPKALKRASLQTRAQAVFDTQGSRSPSRSGTGSPLPRKGSPAGGLNSSGSGSTSQSVTWVCPICSFSNVLSSGFDATTANEHTTLPACQACGIKPPLAHLLKAAISSVTARSAGPSSQQQLQSLIAGYSQEYDVRQDCNNNYLAGDGASISQSSVRCPRCTFENHPSLLSCEMCGASLVSMDHANPALQNEVERPESPGPSLDTSKPSIDDSLDYVKISFRAGGDKVFHERLKGAMVQRKWLLEHAPPMPQQQQSRSETPLSSSPNTAAASLKGVGIAGLERLGLERRRNNETVISSAFEDLEALMASAKEIIALAESFADKSSDSSSSKLLSESAVALGLATTKDMLDSASGSDSLYLSELSRTLAEYLTDDRQGILKREGGIMSLVDLWATFNRARNGVELVSPSDFEKAARLWEKLGLPVRLREFKNGLLVVQRYDWTDDKTIAQLLAWLQEFHETAAVVETATADAAPTWDQSAFGRGVTAQETAARFGWSVGVASEELEMAEEKGVLCREEGIEGLKFWENWIVQEVD